MSQLIDSDIAGKAKEIKMNEKKEKTNPEYDQLSLFSSPVEMTIANELKTMDLNNMTPMKAMLYLQELKERLQND